MFPSVIGKKGMKKLTKKLYMCSLQYAPTLSPLYILIEHSSRSSCCLPQPGLFTCVYVTKKILAWSI